MKKIFALIPFAAFALLAGCTPENTETVKESPVIQTQETVTAEAAGGDITINYTIANPVEGQQLTAAAEDCGWLSIKETTEASVIANVAANETEDSRSAEITLSYAGAEHVTVTVTQNGTTPDNPDDEDDDFIQDTGLSFQIEIVSVSSRSVTVNCIPSDLEATYIAMASDYDDYYALEENSREFFEQDINYFIEWGMTFGEEGITEEECIAMFTRTGAMENYEITLDKPMSKYVFYAYGLNHDGTVTSKVFKQEFTTTEPEQQECTFDFMVRPTLEGMRINVIPSSIYVQYYWNVMPKSEFDAYGEDAADRIAEELLEESQSSGTGMGQVLYYHNQSGSFNELNDGEEYVVFAFGCDVSGVVTTPLMKEEFTAQRLEKVNCTFTIVPKDVMATTFSAEIIPSDPDLKWFAYTLPYEIIEAYPTLEEMTEDVLDILASSGVDWMSELVHTGTQTLSNYDMMGDAATPETRQFIGVLAISEYGTRISDLTTSSLVTNADDGSDDVNIDVNIEILNKSASNASVKFTPYPDEYYVYGVLETSFFDGYDTDDVKIASVLSYYVINDMLNTRITFDELIYNPDGLTKGTEYTAFAFGYTDIVGKTFFSETFVAE